MSRRSSTISVFFIPTKGVSRKRSRCTSARWRFAAGPILEGHSDIAQSNCNLAVLYHARGDLTRAEELYRESLRGWEDLEKPPADYEIVASNYADLLRSLGKKRKAAADRIARPEKARHADWALAVEAAARNLQAARRDAHVAEWQTRTGSGPYGETRGGSTPLVSRRSARRQTRSASSLARSIFRSGK